MIDLTTTITVNGDEGTRFLANLASFREVPRALRWLASSAYRSIEVHRSEAEEVAEFLGGLIDAGWIDRERPPLLFSPRVGDRVRVRNDVLAEVGREAPGLPPSWQFIPAGTTGKMLGWRGEGRAVIEVEGMERRLVVFLSTDRVTRANLPGRAHRRCG